MSQVFWDGREIGTTVVRRKTLNPVWFAGPTGKKPPAAALQEEKPYFWMESTRSVNPCLRVEVFDWDAVGSHDFLGGIELDVGEIVELQRKTLGKARAAGGNTDDQVCGLKFSQVKPVSCLLLLLYARQDIVRVLVASTCFKTDTSLPLSLPSVPPATTEDSPQD